MSDICASKGVATLSWTTAVDIDFTAQPTQTLSPNGNYIIGGFTFMKVNSANEDANTVLTNGVGIQITPKLGTDYWTVTRSGPLLYIPLTTLIPTVCYNSRIRAMIYVDGNWAANYDVVGVFVEDPTEVSCVAAEKMWWDAVSIAGKKIYRGAAANFHVVDATKTVIMIEMWHGVGALNVSGSSAGTAYPFDPESMQKQVGWGVSGGNPISTEEVFWGPPAQWNVGFEAHRGASGNAFVATVKAFRVDYINFG